MRGRYSGARMSTVGSVIPGASRLVGTGVELSKAARQRLKWMDYYEGHDRNASLTARYFGIARKTFWKWRVRYDPFNLRTLEDRSRRPHRVRAPQWLPRLVEAILRVRSRYPRWGKDKIVVILRRWGFRVSTSKVGRILADYRRRGLLPVPPLVRRLQARRMRPRPHAIRKPKGSTGWRRRATWCNWTRSSSGHSPA
jgi:putative transposase